MTVRIDLNLVKPLHAQRAKQCPVRLQNDMLPPEGTVLGQPSVPDQERMKAGLDFEEAAFERLQNLHPDAVRVRHDGDRSGRTLAAMKAGVPLILGGTLPDDLVGRRSGQPDLLVRAEGGYVPGDVKHHGLTETAAGHSVRVGSLEHLAHAAAEGLADTRWRNAHEKNDALQLAHYWRMLEHHGLAATGPARGIILDRFEQLCWFELDEAKWRTAWQDAPATWLERYDHEFALRLEVAAHTQRRVDGSELSPRVVPVSVGECSRCPWHDPCHAELRKQDHVSLLPRSTWERYREFSTRGVLTRQQLADLDALTAQVLTSLTGPMLAKVETVDDAAELGSTLSKRPELVADLEAQEIRTAGQLRAVLHAPTLVFRDAKVGNLVENIDVARAAVAGVPHRRRGAPAWSLPQAAVEIDVDMEASDTQRFYLWGALPVIQGEVAEYLAFDTYAPLTDEEEAQVFIRFWAWLGQMRERAHDLGGALRIYFWTNAELTAMRAIIKRAASPGLPTSDELEAVIKAEWVDLAKLYDAQVVTGGSTSIKTVAKSLDFAWDVDDEGGDFSMVQHAHAVEGDAEAVDWLHLYNRSDVCATWVIRTWMRAEIEKLPRIEERASGGGPA